MGSDRKSEDWFQQSLAAILFSMVGVGYLFPFSALTQPVDYWHYVFPDFNVEFPLTTLYMWVNLIFLAIIVFSNRVPSYTFRIVGGFIGQVIVLLFVPSLYFFKLSETNNYILIMIATSFAAIVTALVDSCIISLAAQYPVKIQESLQFGIGLSTLIGSIYRLATKAVFPTNAVVLSSLVYFYSGAVTIVLCIFAYYYLLTMEISKKYLKFGQAKDLNHSNHNLEMINSLEAQNSKIKNDSRINLESNNHNTCENMSLLNQNHMKIKEYGENSTPLPNSMIDTNEINPWKIFWKIWFNEFLLFLVFFTSLALWPPLITVIPSYNFPSLQASFTNGYIGSLCVLMVSECVQEHERGLAGTFTGFFLNLGLVFGATFSLWLEKAVLNN
eukprot:gene17324-23915_t